MAADWTLAREEKNGWRGSATQHTLHRGDAGRRPPGTARRRWEMLSRPTRVNRDTAVYRACVRCGLARRVRHTCHHGQSAWVVRRLPYVYVLATAHVVYAHVTPPLGNPLGCRVGSGPYSSHPSLRSWLTLRGLLTFGFFVSRCEKQKNFPRPCFLVLARRRDGHREPIVGDFAALWVPKAVQYESSKGSGRARSP